jgi:hypothetical protein
MPADETAAIKVILDIRSVLDVGMFKRFPRLE